MLELKLLGIPQLKLDGDVLALPSPKLLGLLSYLAVQSEARTRKELLELFWDAGKSSNVRFALFKLRDLPGSEDWLETTDKFVKTRVVTDVKQFEDAVNEGCFSDALDIWHEGDEGDKTLLKGLELEDATHFMSWLELERNRLGQLYLKALEQSISELEQREKLGDALNLAHLLLDEDKLNETAHRAVMRLEHKRGKTETALAQFERCRQILKDELGVEPLADTLELLREIEGGGLASGKNAVLANISEAVPARPEKLVGRTDLIGNTLTALQEQKRVLLHGFGGAGKTALAAEIAKTYLETEQDKILWLQAGDDPPDALFDALARAFEAQQQVSQAKGDAKAKLIRDLLSKHNVSLFVLDDVWNAYALSKVMEAVPENIPLLATSRQRYPKLKRLDVGRLAREDGLELLSHHAQLDLSADPDADKLCDVLGDHAFALRIAGINLQVDELAPEALLKQITDAPHTMKTPPDFAEEGRESVTALLTASLNALPEDAYEAFMGFGVLFTTSSTPELLSLCTRRGEEETEEALFTLQKRGLAERVSEPGSDVVTYRVHDLAYSFARANNHYRLTTVQRACKTFLEKNEQNFDDLDAEISNLLGAVQAAKEYENDPLLTEMMRRLVVGDAYYLARGHSPRSLALLKDAIEASKRLEDFETTHYLVARLGDSYRDLLGNYEAALAAYHDALSIAQQRSDYQREIVVLSLIGMSRFRQGEDDATTYLEQAHQLAVKYKDDRALCQVLEHRGCLAGWQGQLEASREFLLQALTANNRLVSSTTNEPELSRLRFFILFNLGVTEMKLDNLEEALGKFAAALDFSREKQNLLWMTYVLMQQGNAYHAMKEHERAQDAFRQAFKLCQQNEFLASLDKLKAYLKTANYPLPEEVASLQPT